MTIIRQALNINEEYKGRLQEFRDNRNVSKKHTFTSREVSGRAGHAKKISEDIFVKRYLSQLDFAICQIKKSFAADKDKLIGNNGTEDAKKGELGSNLLELFDLLRNTM